MLSPGSRIDAYELVCMLGEGGMAQVWVARRHGAHGFEKLLAVKVIHSRYAAEPLFRAMFLDEARITAAVHHPNVAQVFDLGESDDMLYLVMEYVDGEPVSSLLAEAWQRDGIGVTPVDVALRVTRDVCAGLDAAHSLTAPDGSPRGVVHRDVSPQNVLLGVRGEVKVIDFGIALARNRIAGETIDGSVKGKLHYMAPEQARHQPLGPTADVFGAGALLYAMLCGDSPFADETDVGTLQRLLSGEPAHIPAELPPLVRDVLARSLALAPADRYPTAAAMGAAVDDAMTLLGAHRADVGRWVSRNLSEKALARRAELTSRVRESATRVDELPAPREVPDLPLPAAPPTPRAARASGALSSTSSSSELAADVVLDLDRAHAAPAAAPGPSASRLAVATPLSPMDGTVRLANAAVNAMAAAARPAPAPPAVSAPPRPSAPEAAREPAPEFFDVRALAARASRPDAGDALSSVARNAPHAGAGAKAAAAVATRPTARGVRAPHIALGGAAAVVVVLIGLALVVIPIWVRTRIVAAAHAAGIELRIERCSVTFSGVTLSGVTATPQDAPSLVVRAAEVKTRGFSAADVRASDVAVEAKGPLVEAAANVERAVERVARATDASGDPRHFAVVRARIDWEGAFGEGTKVTGDGAGFEVEQRRRDPSERARAAAAAAAAGVPRAASAASLASPDVVVVRGASENLWVHTRSGTLGPWGVSFEVDGASNRVRLLFDPAVPDGPSALYVWGPSTSDALTVRIPRVPLANLGVPAAMVGGGSPEVEAHVETKITQRGRLEAKAKLDAFGVKLAKTRAATDVHVEGSASGVPGKPLDLERTTAQIGPFTATLAGTVEVTAASLRLDTTWRVAPIPCAQFVRHEAKGMGPLAAALQDFGEVTGAARVTGTAHAAGSLLVDTTAPEPVSFGAKTRDTCGLSVFGW